MKILKSKKEDLIQLFPIDLPQMDIIMPVNDENELIATYFQRNTEDPKRNWDAYEKHHGIQSIYSISIDEFSMEYPEEFDEIYSINLEHLINKQISKEDKILLSLGLSAYNSEGVHLEIIQRNQDSSLKGVPSKFYSNLAAHLKNKNIAFITAEPINEDLEEYWKNQGFKELKDVPEKIRETLPPFEKQYLIHILDEQNF